MQETHAELWLFGNLIKAIIEMINPGGIINYSPQKLKLKLMGIPVLGTRDITFVVMSLNDERVIFAIPSAPGDVIQDLQRFVEKSGPLNKIMYGIYNIF